ncbi:nascent polypeptide-associated complex protein [Candidatus Pacearchaeota archaeon]|nr:nascent polypeptide-associated complex protein [Candidatus Pacearchaeota archaeon]
MFGLGGLDPKKMQAVMKQMGISQQEIDASRVIIEKTDGNKIVIQPANVTKIKMQGQESFQITGEAKEEEQGISEDDLKTVMEKTRASKKEAQKALEETKGDLAEAILKLS